MAAEKDKPQRGKGIDWEAVEKDYRSGIPSLRTIGDQHGVSEGMIRKKAKAEGWLRDLTGRIAHEVRNELVRDAVRNLDSAYSESKKATEKEIVEQAAAVQVQVVRDHQKLGKRGMQAVQLLSVRLEEAIRESEQITDEIKASTKDTETRKRMLRAVSLEKLIVLVTNLGNAARTWIGIEREAFSIQGDGLPPPPPETPVTELTEEQIDRRIAELAKEAGISLAAVREGAQDAGK